jgi:hypothetical protein
MLHPRARGVVKWIAPAGEYTIDEVILRTEFSGKESEHKMLQVRLDCPLFSSSSSCGSPLFLWLTLSLFLCVAYSPPPPPPPPPRSGLCASCGRQRRSWLPTTRC